MNKDGIQPFARHGDVTIYKVDRSLVNLADAKEIDPVNGRYILAEGEVTGHAHAISDTEAVKMYTSPTGEGMFVDVLKPAKLQHEEHDTIDLPVGLFYTSIKRQHSPDGWSRVVD